MDRLTHSLESIFPFQNAAQLIKMALRKKQEAALRQSSQIVASCQTEFKPPYEDSDDSSSSMHPQPHYHKNRLSFSNQKNEEGSEEESNNDDFFDNDMNSSMNRYQEGFTGNYGPDFMSEANNSGRVRNFFTSTNFQPGKNTLGKQYNEDFRRNFIGNLMQLLKGVDKQHYMNIIAVEAGKIRVYPNQVAVWMGIYRIAFRVEAENRKRKLTEEDAIYMVEQSLVNYLNNNPQEKKYRFIRVANGTFRALGIRKCTGDYWLKSFIRKFESKFNRRIDLRGLLKGCKKEIMRGGDEDLFERDSEYENQRMFDQSENTKRQIIENIDMIISNAVARIFKDKERELGTNEQVLKSWYRAYGKFHIFRQSVPSSGRNFREGVPNFSNLHNGKSQALNRVEHMILEFIHHSTNCQRSQIEFEANQILSSIRVPQLQNPRIARGWLTNFLQKRCSQNGQFYHLNNESLTFLKGKSFKS